MRIVNAPAARPVDKIAHNSHRFPRTIAVWFTISVSVFDEKDVPSATGVALKLAAVTVAFPLTNVLGFTLVGIAAGMSSVLGVKRDGVYADGRTLVVRGSGTQDGVFALRFCNEDELRAEAILGTAASGGVQDQYAGARTEPCSETV